jgi:hypothetical protein
VLASVLDSQIPVNLHRAAATFAPGTARHFHVLWNLFAIGAHGIVLHRRSDPTAIALVVPTP